MPLRRVFLAVLLFAVVPNAIAQEHKWGVSASAMLGQSWLGSEDTRRGSLFSVTRSQHEPRLHFWGYDAELDYEAYYLFTRGGTAFLAGPNSSHHYGLMAVGRFYQHYAKSSRAFVEGGWGLQFTNRLTHDIDTRINSTPMIGAGIIVPLGDEDLTIGLRYFHISNAGTRGGNEGSNFFQVRVGLRF